MDKIITAKDVQGVGVEKFTRAVLGKRWQQNTYPAGAADEPIVAAEIEQDRLIIKCPFCAGAEMADPDDLRFFCLSCFNAKAGGKWLKVTLPKGWE